MGLTTRKNYRLFLYVNTLVILLLGAAVAGWVVFLLFPENLLGQGYHSALAAVHAIRKVLFWKVAAIYAVIALLIVLSMAAIHLFYSHLIAGPTYRISREAVKIAQGNLTCNFTLRRKDNLTDMKDLLNNVGYQYRVRLDAIGDYLAVIEIQSKTASDLIQQGKNGVALREAAEEITKNIKNIERSLSEIKT